MNKIFIILSLFMLGVFSLMVLSIGYMNLMMEIMVGKKHKWIDFILNTSAVPLVWSKKFDKKLIKYANDPRKIEEIKIKADMAYIRRMDKLISYIKVSTLVEGEDVRNQIIGDLRNIQDGWKGKGGTYGGFGSNSNKEKLNRGYSF